METEKGQKRLSLDMDSVIFEALKIESIKCNISMKKYMLQAILARLAHDQQPDQLR